MKRFLLLAAAAMLAACAPDPEPVPPAITLAVSVSAQQDIIPLDRVVKSQRGTVSLRGVPGEWQLFEASID